MRICRADEIFRDPQDHVFRESKVRTLFWFAAFVAVAGGLGWLAWGDCELVGRVIGGTLAVACGLIAMLMLRGTLGVLRGSDNWLLRISHQRVLIKFRSYANYKLPAGVPCVVDLPLEEIATVRKAMVNHIRTERHDGEETKSKDPRFYLELGVSPGITDALKEALRGEREATNRHIGVTQGHYPVSVHGAGVIRVLMLSGATSVKPRVDEAVRLLSHGRQVLPETRAEFP